MIVSSPVLKQPWRAFGNLSFWFRDQLERCLSFSKKEDRISRDRYFYYRFLVAIVERTLKITLIFGKLLCKIQPTSNNSVNIMRDSLKGFRHLLSILFNRTHLNNGLLLKYVMSEIAIIKAMGTSKWCNG